jgi:hypothetical protein
MFESRGPVEKPQRRLTRSKSHPVLSLDTPSDSARDGLAQHLARRPLIEGSDSTAVKPKIGTAQDVEWLDLARSPPDTDEYRWSVYLNDREKNRTRRKNGRFGMYPKLHPFLMQKTSASALSRQRSLLGDTTLSLTERMAIRAYTSDSNWYVNAFLRAGDNTPLPNCMFPAETSISLDSAAERGRQLAALLESLPATGNVTLFRGGSGDRGTSGLHFRSDAIRCGDILVNNDFVSFTENPYTLAMFCKSPTKQTDETSVVFELTSHNAAKAIAPLSGRYMQYEDESLYSPMHCFKVTAIKAIDLYINGAAEPLIVVSIEEVGRTDDELKRAGRDRQSVASGGERYFDFRTGEPFDYQTTVGRLFEGKEL